MASAFLTQFPPGTFELRLRPFVDSVGRLDAGFVSLGDASMSSFVADFEWESFRSSGLGRSRMGPAGIARYLRTKAIARIPGSHCRHVRRL